jgi:hypothetical protein
VELVVLEEDMLLDELPVVLLEDEAPAVPEGPPSVSR